MGGGDSSCSLHLEHRIFGTLQIIHIAGFKERKVDKFIQDRKNITSVSFDKPISKTFFKYQDWGYGFLSCKWLNLEI